MITGFSKWTRLHFHSSLVSMSLMCTITHQILVRLDADFNIFSRGSQLKTSKCMCYVLCCLYSTLSLNEVAVDHCERVVVAGGGEDLQGGLMAEVSNWRLVIQSNVVTPVMLQVRLATIYLTKYGLFRRFFRGISRSLFFCELQWAIEPTCVYETTSFRVGLYNNYADFNYIFVTSITTSC